MAANTPFLLSKLSQEGLLEFHKQSYQMLHSQWNIREQMRKIDLAYLREKDTSDEHWRAKISNESGDTSRYQNITVPIIKPQIYSAVAYQAGIFLTDYPIFNVVADPAYMDAALQFRAIIEENSIRRGWVRELLLFFIDGFKYNLSAIEVVWDKIVSPAIETDLTFRGGREGKPTEVIWEGNCIHRWDMYNTFFDCSVLPYEIPDKGTFAGNTTILSRTALKSYINTLSEKMNVKEAFEAPFGGLSSGGMSTIDSYYIPELNPDALIDSDPTKSQDWMAWASLSRSPASIHYRNIYEVTKEYVRIIPSDFNLSVPARNTPQVWKLIIVNNSVIIHAERQTNAHEKIPVFFGQPNEDGLGYQSKSLATDALPFQDVTSALLNSVIAARRRAITDRVLYDPSRVSAAHINSPNPAAKIPVRPSAYGKPVGESVYQFPYRDDQSSIALQEIPVFTNFANVLNGQNPARQGQFIKGNKTDGQWESTMSNASSKDQLTALLYEAQVFTPVKEVLKLNMLQYQGTASIYSPSEERNIEVDPVALRRAIVNFKFTDGLLPAEKIISSEALKVGMQVIGTSPTLAAGYNIAPLFSYIMKTENVNLTPFEKSPNQLAYEQAIAQWNQLATLAIQKQAPFNVPMPLPEQFGYTPEQQQPQPTPSNPA